MHSLHSLDSLAQGNESIRRKEIVPWPIYRSIDLYRLIDRLDRKLGESWLRLPPFPSIRRSVQRKTNFSRLSRSFPSTSFYFVVLLLAWNDRTLDKFHTLRFISMLLRFYLTSCLSFSSCEENRRGIERDLRGKGRRVIYFQGI